jgi:hypothetical protein
MRKQPIHCLIVLGSMMAVSACSGHSDEDDYHAPAVSQTDGGEAGTAKKDVGTAEAEGINCGLYQPPPDTRHDILGISFGMTADEAYARLACANPAFKLEYDTSGGFSTKALRDGSKPRKTLTASAGLETATVSLIGLPGEEKVVAVQRRVEFGAGSEPPSETIVNRLTTKYGEPSRTIVDSGGSYAWVVFSPDGQKLGPDNSLYSTCTHYQSTSDSISINSECGFTVRTSVSVKLDNPGLAHAFSVTLVEQRKAMDAIEAFDNAVQSMADASRQRELDNAKRAVEQAGQNDEHIPTL